MHALPRSRLIAYGIALPVLAVTLFVRWHLSPVLGERALYSTCLLSVMIAAYFGGFWPGLLVTFVSALATNYFLVEPFFALKLKGTSDSVALILFGLTGAVISGLSESLHRAQRRIVADERCRAEEAQRQTEERFRYLVQNSSDIISVFDAEGTILYQTPSMERVLGHRPQDRIGRNVFRDPIVHPEDFCHKRDFFDTILSRPGIPVTAEFRLRHIDGSWRDIEAIGQNLLDDPTVAGIVANYRDITERKRAEGAVLLSEHRWRCLLEALPQLVWTATPDGACDYFSTQWTDFTGIPESKLLGWHWLDVLHPDDREGTRQAWMAAVKGRGAYDVEYRVRRSDGVYRWFKTRGLPIRDSGGAVFKWLGTCTDITEGKQLEEALRHANARLDLAMRGSNVGIWEIDMPDGVYENGRVHYVNIWEQLGYDPITPTDFATWRALWHPDDAQRVERAAQAYLAGETGEFEAEYRVRHRDGSCHWVLSRGIAVRDAKGLPIRFVGSRTDITDLKRAEKELRQAMESAESPNRAKDEFLANVSHEIRTPMNAILGMTELALDTPLTQDQRQCLKTVKSAADNLLGIINDLLDFSKIEAGKLELDPADFSLRAAVGDPLRALAMRAHKKGLELVSHVHPDVPDALIGDAGRLRQVLLNLVGNALKFTEHGEVVVEVRMADYGWRIADWKDKEASLFSNPPSAICNLQFSVSDTGIGIPADKQATIFRAFEQEDTSTTRKYGGTGLGLTIAARLVALMGGKITVDSEPGRGSTFAFTARFGQQPHPAEAVATRPPVQLHRLRVLIVDDNATNRHILEEWLRGWQMEPAAVGDGVGAMDALWDAVSLGRPYALVLLDARMPETDGLTLVAKIRKRAELSATRLILLTSGDRPGDWARIRELRINAHLLKPIQQEELLETIYRVMSRNEGDTPVAAQPTVAPEPASAPAPTPAPLRILVAEDNEFNAQLLEHLLVRRGHDVRLANNGREALALAGEGGLDLLFLDIHMPELDGFQVIQAIRERERTTGGHLPVIALTARSRKEDRERCLAAGMDDYLAKPLRSVDLFAAIGRVVFAQKAPQPIQPDAGDGTHLLDPVVLLAACGDDAEGLRKMCHNFGAFLPRRLTEVGDALRTQDASRLREAAHKLCGLLSAFSTVAAGVASDLEDQAASGQIEECQPLVEQLEAMGQELMPQVDGLSIETLQHQAGAAGDPK